MAPVILNIILIAGRLYTYRLLHVRSLGRRSLFIYKRELNKLIEINKLEFFLVHKSYN